MDLEHNDYFEDPYEYDEAPAPPPPSHSPRPMYISEQDPWASQAAAWAARRQHAASGYEQPSPVGQDQETDLYPTIPLRREAYPRSAGPDFDGYHYEQPRPQHRHTFDVYQHSHPYGSLDGRPSYEQTSFYDRSHPSTPARSRDHSPRPPKHHSSRPHSRSPAQSRGTSPRPSLAPSDSGRAPRLPSPAFSRYSGGLGYQYERDNGGLGGSAGTRESSQHSKGDYKSVDIRLLHGVDLGDVPVSLIARG